MTDRLKGFTVTLDHDIREDDAETIRKAIQALRHVQSVDPVVADVDDHMNRQRIRHELTEKLFTVLQEDES